MNLSSETWQFNKETLEKIEINTIIHVRTLIFDQYKLFVKMGFFPEHVYDLKNSLESIVEDYCDKNNIPMDNLI